MEQRALALPEDGIPPEVMRVLDPDRHFAELRPEKAADPGSAGEVEPEAIAQQLADMRPHAVLLEMSGDVEGDLKARSDAAWARVAGELAASKNSSRKRLELSAGTAPMNQFTPLYFGVAFCWCFQHCVGMPDVVWKEHVQRDRRPADAPVVDVPTWCKQMARRVESQFGRDWLFLFAAWNQCFRQAVNQCRTLFAYTSAGETAFSNDDLTEGAVALCAALRGHYRPSPGAPLRAVDGDISKVGMVETLTPLARRLLQNVRHASSHIPGTVETRRLMRHETHAYRIVFGEPIFVTVSPAERDTFLTVRLHRVRENDPVCALDPHARAWGGQSKPDLGRDLDAADVAEVDIPGYEARRHIAACDPLACVEAFHVQLRLVLRHLFGVEICVDCPNCQCRQVALASSAAGFRTGAFGRVSAVYASLEHQKSATLHAHMQVFVECLHQHTPLADILAGCRVDDGRSLVDKYLSYKAHVVCETYSDILLAAQRREAAWPDYKEEKRLVSWPAYQRDEDATDESWAAAYRADVQVVQELKQHHVHPKDARGRRQLLRHCRRKGTTDGTCRSRFPRDAELLDAGAVICPGLARQMGLQLSGKRMALGALAGPRNCAWLNGTHPVLAAATRGNTDVQLPWRLPPCDATHSKACRVSGCLKDVDEKALIAATQAAQNAQSGYSADYGNKRPLVALHEIAEWMRGQRQLGKDLAGATAAYQGARHAKRFMSDAYGRGTVRTGVEVANLLTRSRPYEVTAAETIKTAPTEAFPGQAFVRRLESCTGATSDGRPQRQQIVLDKRDKRSKVLTVKDVDIFYGYRGWHPAVAYLSPFEFHRYWKVDFARYASDFAAWLKGQYKQRIEERFGRRVTLAATRRGGGPSGKFV